MRHLSFLFLLTLVLVANEACASPLFIRDSGDGNPQGHIQQWVVKLIIIGIVLFISVLLSLHLYRKCKLQNQQPTAMYELPSATIASADGSRRWRVMAGPPPSSSGLVRVPTSSEEDIGLVTIARVPKAHMKSRITAPTAGMLPV